MNLFRTRTTRYTTLCGANITIINRNNKTTITIEEGSREVIIKGQVAMSLVARSIEQCDMHEPRPFADVLYADIIDYLCFS